jgi:hypothetical protein
MKIAKKKETFSQEVETGLRPPISKGWPEISDMSGITGIAKLSSWMTWCYEKPTVDPR